MAVYGFCEGNNRFEVFSKEEMLSVLQQLIDGGSLAGVDPALSPVVAALKEENGETLSFWMGTEAEFNAIDPAPAVKEIMLRVGADGKVYFCTDCTKLTDLYNNLITDAQNTVADGMGDYLLKSGGSMTGNLNFSKAKTLVELVTGNGDTENGHHYFDIAQTSGTAKTQLRFNTANNGAAVPLADLVQIAQEVDGVKTWFPVLHGGTCKAVSVTLPVAGWSNKTQTVNVDGVTANNAVQVASAPATIKEYGAAGLVCTAQAAGKLTFTCDSVPEVALTVNVIILGV